MDLTFSKTATSALKRLAAIKRMGEGNVVQKALSLYVDVVDEILKGNRVAIVREDCSIVKVYKDV